MLLYSTSNYWVPSICPMWLVCVVIQRIIELFVYLNFYARLNFVKAQMGSWKDTTTEQKKFCVMC